MNKKEKISEIIGALSDDMISESANARGKTTQRKESRIFRALETGISVFAVIAIVAAVIVLPPLLKQESNPAGNPNSSEVQNGLTPIPEASYEPKDNASIDNVSFTYKDDQIFPYYPEEYCSGKIFLIQSKEEFDDFIEALKKETKLQTTDGVIKLDDYKKLYTEEYFAEKDLILMPFEYRPGNYIINGITKVYYPELDGATELYIEMSGAYKSDSDHTQWTGFAIEINEKLPKTTTVSLCYGEYAPEYSVVKLPYYSWLSNEERENGCVLTSREDIDRLIDELGELCGSDMVIEEFVKAFEKYTDSYFLTNSLVIASGYLESGSYDLEFDSFEYVCNGEAVTVNITKLVPPRGDVTDDIFEWALLIECKGVVPSDADININYTKKIKW